MVEPESIYDRRDTLGTLDGVHVSRELAERLLAGLRASETSRGHLAQRVMHEGLGYCGWRQESPRCVEHRALVDELTAALGEETQDRRQETEAPTAEPGEAAPVSCLVSPVSYERSEP